MLKLKKFTGLIEFSLALLALIGIFGFLQLKMGQELVDPDIWLHLKTGEYILEHKSVPHQDIYSATTLGTPWLNHSALTQTLFYLAFKFSGADGLIFLSCLVMLFAFLILFFCAYKDRKLLTLSVILLGLTVYASKIRFNIRPENFSVLFFCSYLLILTRLKNKKWLFILPLLQVAWVNFHGFFILGLFLIALFVIGELLKKGGQLPWEWSTGDPLEKSGLRNLSVVFLLSLVACLINPNLLDGAFYPLKIIFKNLQPDLMRYRITELLPPWKLGSDKVLAYYILSAVSSFSFLLNLKRVNLTLLLLWLSLWAISFNLSRNIIFFNCVAFLAAVDNFSRLDYRILWKRVFADNFKFILKCIGLGTVIFCTGVSNQRLLGDRYYIFDQYRFKSTLLGTSSIYPEKAAAFIKTNRLPNNLFNIFNHGSYLIYSLWPQNLVFIDGRTELYPKELFADYYSLIYTDPYTAGSLLDKYGVNTVLISGKLTSLEELARYLGNNHQWVMVYFNDDGLVFIRDTPQNKELTGRLALTPDKLAVRRADLPKIGLKKVFPDTLVKLAQAFFLLGQDQKALLQAQEALTVLPSCAEAYTVIGNVYLRKADLPQAYAYLRLAVLYGPDNAYCLLAMADYCQKTAKYKEAESIYKRTVRLYPDYAKAHYLLGRLYEDMGSMKKALHYLRRASKLAPFSSEFASRLKQAEAKMQAQGQRR